MTRRVLDGLLTTLPKIMKNSLGQRAKECGFVTSEDRRMEARFAAAMWESAGVNTRAQ